MVMMMVEQIVAVDLGDLIRMVVLEVVVEMEWLV